MTVIDFQHFAIQVSPSPETNDHQVRLFGDGDDLIARFWNDMIGLDPDDILLEPCDLKPSSTTHKATLARCSCGVIGCGSVQVEVHLEDDTVVWIEPRRSLRFRTAQYIAEIDRAQADTSWEPPDRSAARLIRLLVHQIPLGDNGFSFEWASGRVHPGRFTVSLRLEPGPYQVLVSVKRSGESPEQLAEEILRLLSRDPRTWKDVTYFPQRKGLSAPSVVGPGWKVEAG